jgi:hypothetical protein
MQTTSKSAAILAIKGALCGLVYVVAVIINGMIFAALHLHVPDLTPKNISQTQALTTFVLCSMLLGMALMPLAAGLRGKSSVRGLALAFLPFICIGINAPIEMVIFTTLLPRQTVLPFVASFILPALLFGFALAYLSERDPQPASLAQLSGRFFSAHPAASWFWRIPLAILAFPVIYFVFGAMVAPIVVPTYRAGIAGLVLPPLSVILPVQVLRSTLFLAASLPFLILWKRSRVSLLVALGLAHWFLVGLFGLLQGSFLPVTLRIAHSLEIGADSFAYAAVLVLLLVPRSAESTVHVAPPSPVFPS